jgi:hypothetical protein
MFGVTGVEYLLYLFEVFKVKEPKKRIEINNNVMLIKYFIFVKIYVVVKILCCCKQQLNIFSN